MDKNNSEFTLRAHHGMCLAFFIGKGYSGKFTRNMSEVKEYLENVDPIVTVIAGADHVCSHCPNLILGQCLSSKKVNSYDAAVLEKCKISSGIQIHFSEYSALVMKNILDAGFREDICGDCQWTKLCKL